MNLAFRPARHRFRQLRGLREWSPAAIARCLTVAVVGMTLACSGSDQTGVPSKAHPIVLIAVDGVRADHLGCYGYERDTSPNIDALARESILFEWAFAQAPESLPSLVSILTGLYATTHDVVTPDDALREEAATLAEVLSDRSYMTAAFLAGGPSTDGLGQGFSLFDADGSAGPDEFAAKILAWLEDHASNDFLLVVRPPGPDRSKTGGSLAPEELEQAKSAYDDELRSLDDWVGELMEHLRRLGVDRRATIALVATHGRAFGEHGAVSNDTLHAPMTRVPLLLRLPGGREARSVAQIVETIDLMPTLLELTGAEEPASIQGRSLVPLIEGRGKPPYVAFGETTGDGARRFAALGGYRLLLDREGDRAELYHLPDDPLESNDLAGDESEVERLAVLRRHLKAWEEMVAAASLDPAMQTTPMDEETLEQLRSLGYIQ
jgi:arylsulfatase A-like enzyme